MEVAVIKYNAGNIYSVECALRRLGITPIVTDSPEVLMRADKVLFPGVGEASSAMSYLREHGLDRVIVNLTQPVLGICIGLQLLCRHSEEGNADGLGLFDIDVRRFVPQTANRKSRTWAGIHCTISKGLYSRALQRGAMPILYIVTTHRWPPIV